MKSIEEEYPDYSWGEDHATLEGTCKGLQVIGNVSAAAAIIGGVVLLFQGVSPVLAILIALGGVAGGLMVYVIGGGVLLLSEMATNIDYSTNIAMIAEEKARKGL